MPPTFALLTIDATGAAAWGLRDRASIDAPSPPGLRLVAVADGPDLRETTRLLLAHRAAALLARRAWPLAPVAGPQWFLWEAGTRLHAIAPEHLPDGVAALALYGPATPDAPRLLVAVTLGAECDPDTLLASVRRTAATLAPAARPTAGDDAPSLRETLLAAAAAWPDSLAVAARLGVRGAGAAATVSRARAAATLYGLWAGRAAGFRHPPFQFGPDGAVHPELPALLAALGQSPRLTPWHDRQGWLRADWLWTPHPALPGPSGPRAPADAFAHDPAAVIELARLPAHGTPLDVSSATS